MRAKAEAGRCWPNRDRCWNRLLLPTGMMRLVLQQRRLNLGKEIRQTSSARQVHRMYGAAAYGHRPPRMDVQR